MNSLSTFKTTVFNSELERLLYGLKCNQCVGGHIKELQRNVVGMLISMAPVCMWKCSHLIPTRREVPAQGPLPNPKRKRVDPAGEAGDQHPAKRTRKSRSQRCPFAGCTFTDPRLRVHAYKHVPDCLRPTVCNRAARPNLNLRRVALLRRMAEFLTDSPDLEALVAWTNDRWRGPDDELRQVRMPEFLVDEVDTFAREMGWESPLPYLWPLQGAAALIHWRPLAVIFDALTAEEIAELKSMDGTPSVSRRQRKARSKRSRGRRSGRGKRAASHC